MCYQVVERYTSCGCLHHKHAVNPCPQQGNPGHTVEEKTIHVDYACSDHFEISVDPLQEKENDGALSENDRLEPRWTSPTSELRQPDRELFHRKAPKANKAPISFKDGKTGAPTTRRCYACRRHGLECNGQHPICRQCRRARRNCIWDQRKPIKGSTPKHSHDTSQESGSFRGSLEVDRIDLPTRQDSVKNIPPDAFLQHSQDYMSKAWEDYDPPRCVRSTDRQDYGEHDSPAHASPPRSKSRSNLDAAHRLKEDDAYHHERQYDGPLADTEPDFIEKERLLFERISGKSKSPSLDDRHSKPYHDPYDQGHHSRPQRELDQVSLSTLVPGAHSEPPRPSKSPISASAGGISTARRPAPEIPSPPPAPPRAARSAVSRGERTTPNLASTWREPKMTKQYDMTFTETKARLQIMEEEKIQWAEEKEELLRAFLRNTANCLFFPGELDKGVYSSATRHSLELGLAVLEIWPSQIPADHSFDAKTRTALSHLGLCETPLSPGCCRLRWQCRCGVELFDDYAIPDLSSEITMRQQEVLRNAVMKYSIWQALSGFEEMIGTKWLRGISVITRSSPQKGSSVGNVFKSLYHAIRQTIQGLSRDLRRRRAGPGLPSRRDTTVRGESQPSISSQNQPIHLLTCILERSLGTRLHQKQISNLGFDRDLFILLKAMYEEHRGKLPSIFAMRRPTGIHFNEVCIFVATYHCTVLNLSQILLIVLSPFHSVCRHPRA